MNRQAKLNSGLGPVHQLAAGYRAEFDRCSRETWDQAVSRFRDASLYQMWSYDAVRSENRQAVRFILRQEHEIIAAAQARVVIVRGMAGGIAYVRWGPMWRSHGRPDDLHIFRQAVRALRNEFSWRRRLVLRLYPWAYRSDDGDLVQVLYEEGYTRHDRNGAERTLILDLAASVDELRAAMRQKWRNCLNRAERNGLELVFGEEESLFQRMTEAYWQMVARKGLVQTIDADHLLRVHKDLPSGRKLKIFLCFQGSELAAGAVISAVGTTGVYLLGATTDAGLQSKGSYLVQWSIVKWLKENGFALYDLNGVNPSTNPGTYRFKVGLAGNRGREVEFFGRFQVSDSSMSSFVVGVGELLFSGQRRLSRLASVRRSKT